MLDYRDKLALDPETVEALDGLPHSTTEPPDIELRESALTNVAAAHMIGNVAMPEGGRPSAIAVQEDRARAPGALPRRRPR
eukprot:5421021-Pyramimonas_sp.AAC.1